MVFVQSAASAQPADPLAHSLMSLQVLPSLAKPGWHGVLGQVPVRICEMRTPPVASTAVLAWNTALETGPGASRNLPRTLDNCPLIPCTFKTDAPAASKYSSQGSGAELAAFAEVSVQENQSIVCMVGENIGQSQSVAARAFGALNGVRPRMISQGASQLNLSVVVDGADLLKAVELLHTEFFTNFDPEAFE